MPYARRYRPTPGVKNKTETAYALHLDSLILKGHVQSYSFESETLKLAPDCRYTPDFRVLRPTVHIKNEPWTPDTIEFHEVKGSRAKGLKPFVEDDALVKIKLASVLHPMYKFVIVWFSKSDNEWLKREIN